MIRVERRLQKTQEAKEQFVKLQELSCVGLTWGTCKFQTSRFTYYASIMPSSIPSTMAVGRSPVTLRDFSKETMITESQVKPNEVSKRFAKFPAASATFNTAIVAIVAHALHTNMARAGIGSGVRLSAASAFNLEPKKTLSHPVAQHPRIVICGKLVDVSGPWTIVNF